MRLPCILLLCTSLTAAAQAGTAPANVVESTPLSYELVSIHPSKPDATGYDMNNTSNGITARAINLRQLLSEAFGYTLGELLREQIVNLPKWGETQRFDIQAKVDNSDVERLQAARKAETMAVWVRSMVDRKPTADTAMLQQLVTERFLLKMHYEQRPMSVFAMTAARGGLKMAPAKPADPNHGSLSASNGKTTGTNVPLNFLTFLLTPEVGRPVVNRIDLPGGYDFAMTYTPGSGTNASTATDAGPSIFTALDEQLGIKLVSAREPVWVIVIDQVEMPSDN